MSKFTLRSAFIPFALVLVPALVSAHTTLETSTVVEGVRVVNNLQIGHACGTGTSVVGTSVVFPDGKDSTILVNNAQYSGPLSDFVSNWGPNIQPLVSRAVYNNYDEKNGPTGNVVGFWAGGGAGIPNHMVGYLPFRVNATNIVPASCAVSVRFTVNIVDVCKITGEAELHQDGVAEFWTHNALGTIYDRKSATDDGAAQLTSTRNTANNPLPASCGAGSTVVVRPSAAQIVRDIPISIQGVRVWPK